jgi:hypothetical protein
MPKSANKEPAARGCELRDPDTRDGQRPVKHRRLLAISLVSRQCYWARESDAMQPSAIQHRKSAAAPGPNVAPRGGTPLHAIAALAAPLRTNPLVPRRDLRRVLRSTENG